MSTHEQSTPQNDRDRSAQILKRAVQIMAQGHYGWSWALAKAKAELDQRGAQ
jgi:hypothetical protein